MSLSTEQGVKEGKSYEALYPLHEIDSLKGEEIKAHIVSCMEETDAFIVDFSKIAYMNSSGLREMIQIFKLLKERGKLFIIASLSEDVKKVFVHTNLDRLFVFSDSVAEAINLVVSDTCDGVNH